jgi:hypothetical protein
MHCSYIRKIKVSLKWNLSIEAEYKHFVKFIVGKYFIELAN